MGSKQQNESIQESIHQGNELIKSVEKQLKRFSRLRKKLSLDKQASSIVVGNITTSDETLVEANKELQKMGIKPETSEPLSKEKRRNRLARALRSKLQI